MRAHQGNPGRRTLFLSRLKGLFVELLAALERNSTSC